MLSALGCGAPRLLATSSALCSGFLPVGRASLLRPRPLHDMKADADKPRKVEDLDFRGIEAVGDLKYSRDASGDWTLDGSRTRLSHLG
jgi:hypothetical protein